MVLTRDQTTAFFTDLDQMAIDPDTLPGLALEGIALVEDLQDFTEEDIKQVSNNLRRPASTMGQRANGIAGLCAPKGSGA